MTSPGQQLLCVLEASPVPDIRLEALNAWLASHHGVIARGHLRAMGFSDSATRNLVATHRLRRIGRGVFHSPAYPYGREQVMTAACLANPAVAVGFTTAGAEWGMRGMGDPRVHVLVPHGSSPEIDGVVVHRCRRIDPVDIAGRRRDGVRLTSPPRTLFDAASIVGRDATESAIEEALAEHRCTVATLMSTSRRLSHGNRPGAAVFQGVLSSRPVWRRAARSELEREVRQAIDAAGLPAPVVNMPFRLSGGRLIEIDLAFMPWRIAVEVDHPYWHDREADAVRDKQRDRKLQAMGWATPRLTKWDVDHDLAAAVADLAAVLRERGWVRMAA